MGSKELMSKYVLDGTAFQPDHWFFQPHFRLPFQPVRYFRMILCSVLWDPSSMKPCTPRSFLFFKLALGSKPSGDSPESRRDADNGSNRDSSEAVRSGSGESERPESPQIANSFSGINATSSFMM